MPAKKITSGTAEGGDEVVNGKVTDAVAANGADDAKKSHVLIVEDDEFLANIYKTKFEMEGFRVTHADNGEMGLDEAKKKKPNIILLDILMPKMDGFAVLEKLKADKTTKDIPVILLTNLGQKDDVERGLEMGAVDYLIKAHFKPSETVAKVRDILKNKTKRKGVTL